MYGNSFDTANAGYYNTFIELTGFTPFQVTNNIQSPNSPASKLIEG